MSLIVGGTMYQKTSQEIAAEWNVNLKTGLSSKEVEEKRVQYGSNQLEGGKRKSLVLKIFEQLTDILILILLVAAILSVVIDPTEWMESMIILVVIMLNTILGVVQESKAEKSLEALMNLSSPHCNVRREGQTITIPSQEVVVGDVVLLRAGDYIPADGRLMDCSNLTVDESALTGESMPVQKNNSVLAKEQVILSEQRNMVFSSTFVTNGYASFLVTSVGMNTEIGKIAKLIKSSDNALTPLQNKLEVVGKLIGILAIVICIVVFILEMVTGMEMLEAFKTAVALAVAAIPEGLASVVTIVLALGVERMVRKNAIVKKLPAVETLGSCNVICSDKTGTLTENKMTVQRMYTMNGETNFERLNAVEKETLSYFATCCDALVLADKRIGDPTELALVDCQLKYAKDWNVLERIGDVPFDSDRKLMTVVCKKNNRYLQITKGAPDVLFQRCEPSYLLHKAKRIHQEMSSSALRVLAVGIRSYDTPPVKIDRSLENNLQFNGLIGMIDPARKEVVSAIQTAHLAGIKTVMITGDHMATAKAIAEELGILGDKDKVIHSEELQALSDEELEAHIHEYSVFARAIPADKVRIVSAWQNRNMVVAMTGDGVNDAPALKKADIGCAMGITGTDVAKEAADMILVDDNFSTIVSAIKEGRSIYENIRRCIQYLLSSNIGEVLTIFVASIISAFGVLSVGVPLKPIHLLWINLITDSFPAFGLGMERPNDDIMMKKPKRKNEGFFTNHLGLKIAVEGICIGALTIFAYLIGFMVEKSEITGQTMAFLTLSTCQLFHAYNVRTERSIFSWHTFSNKFLNFAFVLGFSLQLIVLYIPTLSEVFKLEALSLMNFSICMALSFGIVLLMEFSKWIRRKRKI